MSLIGFRRTSSPSRPRFSEEQCLFERYNYLLQNLNAIYELYCYRHIYIYIYIYIHIYIHDKSADLYCVDCSSSCLGFSYMIRWFLNSILFLVAQLDRVVCKAYCCIHKLNDKCTLPCISLSDELLQPAGTSCNNQSHISDYQRDISNTQNLSEHRGSSS